jgi:hypothetical protein
MDADGVWRGACATARPFEFTDGGPIANYFRHCPYCGDLLTEAPAANRADHCHWCGHSWAAHQNLTGCCAQHEGQYCYCQRLRP